MYDHLNTVSSSYPYIPAQAFLYQPVSKNPNIQTLSLQQLQTDDFIIVTTKKQIKRLIFQGDTPYTQFQNQKLQEFRQYIQRKNIAIDPRWTRSWRLRWLQSTNYDNKKTVQDMEQYIEYIDKNKEIHLTANIEKHLKAGYYYLAGRDSKFRPLLILDIKKLLKAKINEQEFQQCQVYFFQFIMRNMLIPGQVEMWNTIIDVGYEGVMSMMGPMKASISFLQSTFRSRMYVASITRPSGTCSFLWSIAQKFLQEDTKRKVKFVEGEVMTQLLEYCSSTQLQQKFGGQLQNFALNSNWPPRIYGNKFTSNLPVKMLTIQEYRAKYFSNQLPNTKIYEPYIFNKDQLKLDLRSPQEKLNQNNFSHSAKVQTSNKKQKQIHMNQPHPVQLKRMTIDELFQVEKKFLKSLQKLQEQDLSFLHELHLQVKTLQPYDGFDWLAQKHNINN